MTNRVVKTFSQKRKMILTVASHYEDVVISVEIGLEGRLMWTTAASFCIHGTNGAAYSRTLTQSSS